SVGITCLNFLPSIFEKSPGDKEVENLLHLPVVACSSMTTSLFSAHQTCGTVPRHISGLIGHKEASRFLSEVSVVPVTLWYSYGRNLTELTLRAQPTGGHQTRDTGSGDWWRIAGMTIGSLLAVQKNQQATLPALLMCLKTTSFGTAFFALRQFIVNGILHIIIYNEKGILSRAISDRELWKTVRTIQLSQSDLQHKTLNCQINQLQECISTRHLNKPQLAN
ncbi:hypothetical protein PSTT_16028, partial [Puccinia striiformis]